MGLRLRPYAFTVHGIAMIASVLQTKRATDFNIAVVRVFVALRRFHSSPGGAHSPASGP